MNTSVALLHYPAHLKHRTDIVSIRPILPPFLTTRAVVSTAYRPDEKGYQPQLRLYQGTTPHSGHRSDNAGVLSQAFPTNCIRTFIATGSGGVLVNAIQTLHQTILEDIHA
jgi:hypothetical protein